MCIVPWKMMQQRYCFFSLEAAYLFIFSMQEIIGFYTSRFLSKYFFYFY